MAKILVVDYECGNLGCIRNALDYLDYEVEIVHLSRLIDLDPSGCLVILPGVGNYSYAIHKIMRYTSFPVLTNWLLKTEKLMCICLGFQLLFKESFENNIVDSLPSSSATSVNGLSIFSSSVLPLGLNSSPSLNVGWRRPCHHINQSNDYMTACFDQIASHSFYHMHSYGLPVDKHALDLESYDWYVTCKHISSDIEFVTAFLCKNILGLQFHPEKSGQYGLDLIKKFFS